MEERKLTTRYYFSWFNEGLPERLIKALQRDISDRKSLVMINGQPTKFDYPDISLVKDRWLTPASIVFDKYHMIDYRKTKSEAHQLLQEASVIFLCGGVTMDLHEFIVAYDLSDVINKTSGVILGASAGAINMSRQWLCSKQTGSLVERSSVCEGLGLDDFFFCSKANLTLDDNELIDELLPLSQRFDSYLAINEGAIRIKKGQMGIFGEVHRLSQGQLKQMPETF